METKPGKAWDVMVDAWRRRPRSTSRFHVAVAVAVHAHDRAHVEDL